MSLSPGTKLGPYEVAEAIGAGGMGEVYRARDTKLGREVALKVLPDLFADDPQRLGRFQREAKVLVSMNHPNIAVIHGLEEADGVRALVLELVDGRTLADRIAQGAMPLEEALAIARQIAEGLEAAHEHGIIHRDLKPSNVIVKEDGQVKVLDFGLAKALEGVEDEEDLSSSPDVPPSVAQLLRRCLTKDRKRRLQSIGEARIAIEDYLAEPDTAAPSEAAKPRSPMLSWALAGVFGVAFLVTLWVLWPSPSPVASSMRLSVKLGAGDHRLVDHGARHGAMAVLSPDGKTLAFLGRTADGNSQIYLRPLDSLEPTPLGGTEGAASPFFSPDGRWLAYSSNESGDGEVYVRPFPGPGGKSQVSTGGGSYPIWSRDGRRLFFLTPDWRIMVVDYTSSDSFAAGKPQVWSQKRYGPAELLRGACSQGDRREGLTRSSATPHEPVGLSVVDARTL